MADNIKDEFSATSSSRAEMDWFVFGSASFILLILIVCLATYPESSANIINRFYIFVTSSVGVIYVIVAFLVLSFLVWLSFSKYGLIIFGDTSAPAYSEFSWCSMLFCAGIGASLLYWGAAEWVFYFTSPPFGCLLYTSDAADE